MALYEVEFETKAHRKVLVAALDIESEVMNANQLKAFSDIFRTALSRTGEFELASSSDIDKMNPDEIQQATGCTRDTCATIIGEQLGVDRVISSSFFEIEEGSYVLSAKMMDIKDGSILVSETINHSGGFSNLEQSITKLAQKLVGGPEDLEVYREEESSNFIWHASALILAFASAYQAQSSVDEYDDLAVRNVELESQYRNAVRQAELEGIQTEYNANQEEMKTHKRNAILFNGLAFLAASWEMYLIFFADDASDPEDMEKESLTRDKRIPRKIFVGFRTDVDTFRIQPEVGFRYRW